jgi:DNA-binding NarL/FixJ family response regulator
MVVGEADECDDGVRLATSRSADVVVIALEQFADSELEHLAEALVPTDRARILVVAKTDEPESVLRAFRAGALGIVTRDQSIATLVRAIERVHASEAWYSRTSVATLLKSLPRTGAALDPEAARVSALTRREREVMRLASEGLSNREIAARLFISEITVRHHLTSVFEKLGVANRFELLRLASRAEIGP